MRLLIILVLFLTPIVSMAQTATPEIEKAYYEVNVNGESAFYTNLQCSSGQFSKAQFRTLEQIAMEKEGVFNVAYLDNGNTIRIAHLSYVEARTLKSFGTMICDGIEVEERQSYSF